MTKRLAAITVAALVLFSGTAGAKTPPLKCHRVPSGSTFDISYQERAFRNGAIGTRQLWQVDNSRGQGYVSGKLIGGSAQGRIATWVIVPQRQDKPLFTWANREAFTYSIIGIAASNAGLGVQNASKAAKLSRKCAARNHA